MPTKKPIEAPKHDAARSFVAGGVGAAFAKTLTAPLARVTILLQTKTLNLPVVLKRPEFVLTGDGNYYYSYRAPTGVDRPSLFSALRSVFQSEGIKGLWRGNFVSCIHRIPYSGITFLVHDQMKTEFGDFTAGAAAGALAATTAYPLDVVKTRMVTDARFARILPTFKTIIEEEGFSALYRGLVPTLAHVVPSFAISFYTYGIMKERILAHSHSSVGMTGPQALVCGSISGFTSAALLFPVDLVRRRLQISNTHGLVSCIQDILNRDGPGGFYRGLAPELAKVVPYVGALFFAVEAIKNAL